MAKSGRYKLAFRRRVEGKTDYAQRRSLLQSGLTRFAVRLTGNRVIIQAVKPMVKGDNIVAFASSAELGSDYGWQGSTGNVPASYLTGLLAGLKARKNGITKGVLDVGRQRPTKGSRVTAALKGIVDAGLEIPHGEEILPNADRLSGKHVADYARKLSAADDANYRKRFSQYLRRGNEPQNLPSHFEDAKKRILAKYSQ